MNNVNQSLKSRLEAYRKAAEEHNERYPNLPATWKHCRYPKPGVLKKPTLTWSEDRQKLWADNIDDLPFYLLGDAHEVNRGIQHTGWFADNFQESIIKGAVLMYRNPHEINHHNDSHQFYLVATYSPDWDFVCVYMDDHYEDHMDAARAADEYSRVLAEKEREYRAEEQAKEEIKECKKTYHNTNKETIKLIRSYKKTLTDERSLLPVEIVNTVKKAVKSAIEERKQALARINALEENFWIVVPDY